jgi:hypothetical protein
MLRLALPLIAIAPLFSSPGLAQSRDGLPPEVVRTPFAACGMINIGTPERPRLVKDPACSRGDR